MQIPNTPDIRKARAAVINHESFPEYKKLYQTLDKVMDEYMDLLHKKALYQRVKYLLVTLLLEEQMQEIGSQDLLDKYIALKKCESDSYFPTKIQPDPSRFASVH